MRLYQIVLEVGDDFIPETMEIQVQCPVSVNVATEGFIGPAFMEKKFDTEEDLVNALNDQVAAKAQTQTMADQLNQSESLADIATDPAEVIGTDENPEEIIESEPAEESEEIDEKPEETEE